MKNVAVYLVCKTNRQLLTQAGADGTITLADYDGKTNLLFWIEETPDGYCNLIHRRTGMVLDGNTDGVYLHVPNGDDYQKWQLEDAGDGYLNLFQKAAYLQNTKYVLTANADESVIVAAYSENADNQKWSRAFSGSFIQKATEKVLTRNDDKVGLSEVDDTAQQTFYFEHVGGNDYMIGEFAQIQTEALALGRQDDGSLNMSRWLHLDSQKWQIEDVDGNFLKLSLKSTGNLVLDGNGSALYLHAPKDGNDYQLWSPFVRLSLDRTKPYNQLTFAMAHDSHTDKKTSYYSHDTGSPAWEVQTQDITEQLTGGIRAGRISTGLHSLGGSNIILQHTIALKAFSDYLERVRNFLDRNPNAILTIYDEGDSSVSWHTDEQFEGYLANQYAETLGGTSGAPNRIFLPGANKMPTLDELKNGKWPTVQAMLDAGVQIIVIMAHGFPKVTDENNALVHPWILPAADMLSATPYDYLIQDDVMDVRPACVNVTPTQALGSKLFKFNHFFYSPIAGKEESSQALSIWTVGDLLVEDTLRAWSVNGRPPNWINVDFYQGVNGAKSHLTHLVRAINSSNTLADLEQKVKGCYIQNANGLQIGHPYTTAADTPLYQIINRKTDTSGLSYALNLGWSDITDLYPPYVAIGLVSLGKYVDTTPSQQWYLKYNTPEHGIQLGMASGGFQYVLHTAPLLLHHVTVISTPNMTSQVPENLGGSDTGWELVYNSSTDDYLIRVSGDSTKVLGIHGGEVGENISVSIVTYNAADVSQRWRFNPINPQPYPPFLPSGF